MSRGTVDVAGNERERSLRRTIEALLRGSWDDPAVRAEAGDPREFPVVSASVCLIVLRERLGRPTDPVAVTTFATGGSVLDEVGEPIPAWIVEGAVRGVLGETAMLAGLPPSAVADLQFSLLAELRRNAGATTVPAGRATEVRAAVARAVRALAVGDPTPAEPSSGGQS